MDLYEHQAKDVFRRFGIPVPDGKVASTPDGVRKVAERLGGRVVVKAQVQTGGRGKAGGIKLAETPAEAAEVSGRILGMDIKGHKVRKVLVERAGDIASEFYAAFLLDRSEKSRAVLGMVSAQGGVDIEEVADTEPEAIARVNVSPLIGLQPYHVRGLVFGAGLPAAARRGVSDLLPKLYRAFIEADASLVEVNPLVLTGTGDVMALDAKVSLDDNAEFRQPDIERLRDTAALDKQERAAKERGLNYVKLDGTVGIIGNGAGLTMSTLDVVAQAGGTPANFLDIGGGANADTMAAGIGVILSDRKVKSLLVNIFGGITRCDLVAQGILQALAQLGEVRAPIVVRLDGTNADEGRRILQEAGHPAVVPSPTMLEAASTAVQLAKKRRR